MPRTARCGACGITNGLSSLVEFPAPYKETRTSHDFDYGTDVFDIDVSPDGQFLTGAMADVSGRQKLDSISNQIELAQGRSPLFEELYDFEVQFAG